MIQAIDDFPNLELSYCFTDSYSDISLIEHFNKKNVINPSEKTVKKFKSILQDDFNILNWKDESHF